MTNVPSISFPQGKPCQSPPYEPSTRVDHCLLPLLPKNRVERGSVRPALRPFLGGIAARGCLLSHLLALHDSPRETGGSGLVALATCWMFWSLEWVLINQYLRNNTTWFFTLYGVHVYYVGEVFRNCLQIMPPIKVAKSPAI